MKLIDVIWAILRGLFWGIVDGYPFDNNPGPSASKERPWWEEPAADQAAKEQPRAEQPRAEQPRAEQPRADKPTMPGWWTEPAPPATPPTIKVETDAGTFIAATTFSGPNLMGIRRVERPRQEGESRRRRRAAPGRETSPVAHVDVELRSRELEVPQAAMDPTSTPARIDADRQPRKVDAPRVGSTSGESSTLLGGAHAAVPIDAAEAPRVARARRVRGRLGATDRGAPRLATTLATRLARRAGVPVWSPHKFKHTGVSVMGEHNAPLTLIQGQAGHAHVSTTARYIHVDEDTHAEKAAAFYAAMATKRPPSATIEQRPGYGPN